jgi:hypothetical protein
MPADNIAPVALNSSMIDQASTEGDDLVIRFLKSQKRYKYINAAHLFHHLVQAESQGNFFNNNIRKEFQFVELAD